MARVNETITTKDILMKLLKKITTKIYIMAQTTPVRDFEDEYFNSETYMSQERCLAKYSEKMKFLLPIAPNL